jgi:DNA polymerase III delta prime subunit
MCNYIYKIDESLKTEFVLLRYNNLPSSQIILFLNEINTNEGLDLSELDLQLIQQKYTSDIRSMLNHMQLIGQSSDKTQNIVFNETEEFELLFTNMTEKKVKWCSFKFQEITTKYYKDNQSLWKKYFLYLLSVKSDRMLIVPSFINDMEKIIKSSNMHYTTQYNEYYFSLLLQYIQYKY